MEVLEESKAKILWMASRLVVLITLQCMQMLNDNTAHLKCK